MARFVAFAILFALTLQGSSGFHVGALLPLTGPLSQFGSEFRLGLLSAVSGSTGIARVDVDVVDEAGFDASSAALLDSWNVSAVTATCTTIPSLLGAFPSVPRPIALFAPPCGSSSLFSGADVSINLRPSFYDELVAAINFFVSNGAIRFSLVNGPGFSEFHPALVSALNAIGMTLFSSATYSLAQQIPLALSNLSAAGTSDVVFFGGDSRDIGELFAAPSLPGIADAVVLFSTSVVMATLNLTVPDGIDFYAVQAIPFFRHRDMVPVPVLFRDYISAIGSAEPSPASYEGYIAGRLMREVAASIQVDSSSIPDTENLVDAVYNYEHFFALPGGVLVGPYGSTQGCPCRGKRGLHELSIAKLIPGSSPNVSTWANIPESLFSWTCCNATSGPVTIPIKFGQSADFSGDLSELGTSLRIGVESAFKKHDGPAAILVALDDRYSVPRAVANVNVLINQYNVLGLLTCMGTGPANAVVGPLAVDKVPFLAAYTGSTSLRSKVSFLREAVNIRPGYAEEIATLIQFFLDTRQSQRFAILYYNNSFGTVTSTLAIDYLCSKRLRPIFTRPCDVSGSDVNEIVSELSALTVVPEVVLLFATYQSASQFVANLKLVYPAETAYGLLSIVGTLPFLGALKTALWSNIFITQVMPDFRQNDTALLRDFHRLVPANRWDFDTLEGFVAGSFAIEILRRIDLGQAPSLMRAKLLDEIYSNTVFDIGGLPIGPFRDWPCNSDETCEINRCNMGLRRVDVISVMPPESGQLLFDFTEVYHNSYNTCGLKYAAGDCALPGSRSPLVAVVASVVGSVLAIVLVLCAAFIIWWMRYVKRLHASGRTHVSLRDISLASIVRSSMASLQESHDAFDPEKSKKLSCSTLGINLSKEALDFGLPHEAPLPLTPIEDTLVVKGLKRNFIRIHLPPPSYKADLKVTPESAVVRKGERASFKFSMCCKCTTTLNMTIYIEVEGVGHTAVQVARATALSMFLDPAEVLLEDTLLGVGAFAKVFKGTWRGSEVAVKMLNCQVLTDIEMQEFITEVDIMHKARHPNILDFVGGVIIPGKLAIVTEFIRTGNLKRVLDTEYLNNVLKLRMTLDIAKGMSYLHQSNIIHRDLKPDNVLVVSLSVRAPVNVKISDFGSSKSSTFQTEERNYTQAIGTPIYMAPEVLANKPYSNKVDVYSFGLLIWELMTEEEPFKEVQTTWEIATLVNQGYRLELPSEMQYQLRDLIRACWDQDPTVRPPFQDIVPRVEAILKTQESNPRKDRKMKKKKRHHVATAPFPVSPHSVKSSLTSPSPTPECPVGSPGSLRAEQGSPSTSSTLQTPRASPPGPAAQSDHPKPAETSTP